VYLNLAFMYLERLQNKVVIMTFSTSI